MTTTDTTDTPCPMPKTERLAGLLYWLTIAYVVFWVLRDILPDLIRLAGVTPLP